MAKAKEAKQEPLEKQLWKNYAKTMMQRNISMLCSD